MSRDRMIPPEPRRPFYDEPEHNRLNPYIGKLYEVEDRLFHPLQAMQMKNRWRSWSNGADIHLEIGPGRGEFLEHHALDNPQTRVIGIELKFKRLYKITRRLHTVNAGNAYMIGFDANYLHFLFGPDELDRIFIFFPDPWGSKKCQNFRRLVRPDQIVRFREFLRPGGWIDIKTDHSEYFSQMTELLHAASFRIERHTTDLHQSEFAGENFETGFEQRFKKRGLSAYYLRAVKP